MAIRSAGLEILFADSAKQPQADTEALQQRNMTIGRVWLVDFHYLRIKGLVALSEYRNGQTNVGQTDRDAGEATY